MPLLGTIRVILAWSQLFEMLILCTEQLWFSIYNVMLLSMQMVVIRTIVEMAL